MSMSMYIYRIRKRFLDSLGITEEQIKEFGGVLSSWKDQDGRGQGEERFDRVDRDRRRQERRTLT